MQLTYDIRGKYPSEVNENLAIFLARKFILFLNKKKINQIIISQDIRKSSIYLINSFAGEILKSKIKIEYLGILPTPLFYYFCLKFKKAGLMVTASHLSLAYNGFKFFIPPNKIWIPKNIPLLKNKKNNNPKNIFKENFIKNAYLDYLKEIKQIIKLKYNHNYYYSNKLKSPNILLFKLLPKVFKNLKIKKDSFISIYSDYDGDRIFIKYKQKLLSPEEILFIVLKINNYQRVGIPITIHKKIKLLFPKTKFFLIKTGHKNFKNAHKKYNLDFALEPSCHYYFFKELKTEAPILAVLNVFKFEEKYNLNEIKKINFPYLRLNTRNIKIIKKLENYAKINNFKIKKFDEFYFYKKINNYDYLAYNIRQSKTEKNLYKIFIESNKLVLINNLVNLIKND
ncbi:MAG: phosphomannomutase [Candidatus Parcubacteria bacterium]|nr:MAG: phosphomannomutase [Candidatus Parcubacteria bacterium]